MDLEKFFDKVNHDILMSKLEKKIKDRRLLTLIRKYLKSGILINGICITSEEGIILIFDEITAGFRLCNGGSHIKLGVNPDMAVFGKAMTNGYPLTTAIGKEKYMQAAQSTFISSTFWTERIAYAATLKSMELFERYDVSSHLNLVGEKVQNIWKEISEKYKLKIHISGIYPVSHFEFEYDSPLAYKTFFTQQMLDKGFLASNAFYASYAHDEIMLDKYRLAVDDVFREISNIIESRDDITKYIDEVCHSGFERLN